jgi:hypothetical protein
MNDSTVTTSIEPEIASALFANLVVQQTNMALIFLGRTPNPETGELIQDLDTAKILIDQLEMLALKSRGNLDAQDSALLNQSLSAVRMAFVEAVEKEPTISPESMTRPEHLAEEKGPPGPAAQPPESPFEDADSRKKFSKKY